MTPDAKVLICEGACNTEAIKDLEWQLPELTKWKEDSHPVATATWIHSIRQLTYTAHDRYIEDGYQCRVCGTMRQYGKTAK